MLGFLSKDMTYSCAIFPDLDADLQLPGSCRSLSTSSRSSLSPEPSLPSSPELVGPTHQKFGFSSPVIGSLEASDRELSGSSTPTLVSESEVLLKRFKAKFGGYLRTRAEVREDEEDEDELYEAQMRKLQHIVQKCAIRPGMQVSILCPPFFFASFLLRDVQSFDLAHLVLGEGAIPREVETGQGLIRSTE